MRYGCADDTRSPFPFFPQPAKGETVYSIFCRCSARSGLQDGQLLREFTGQRHCKTLLAPLPGYLPIIAKKMPHGHPWRDTTLIVRDHTSLPYYTYFDRKMDRDQWVTKLATSMSSHPLSLALGLQLSKCPTSTPHLRYCPTCVEEDRKALGFAYFKREHQLPGVAVCWRHETALAQGCSHCGSYPIKRIALSMPGKCMCTDGILPLPANANLPALTEPLLWLARQSAYLVNSSGSTSDNVRKALKQAVLERGWGRASFLDPGDLAAGVETRFGKEVLEWLGTPAWRDGRPAAWIRRLLNNKHQGERRSPLILFLLVLGTLYESVEDFEKETGKQESVSAGVPLLPTELPRPPWSKELSELLEAGYFKLCGIAKRFGVSPYKVAVEARSNQWRVPLSPQTRKDLGDEKITAIKDALRNGDEKTTIMRRYDCNAWAITLIELDEPGLNELYRRAAKLLRVNENRCRLEQYLATCPDATRTDVMRHHPALYEALLRNDREWFYELIPKKRLATSGRHKSRVDWDVLDQQKQVEIARIIDDMLAPGNKPVQVTVNAVLKQARLKCRYNNNPSKFPLVGETLRTRSESYPDFLKRRITWAVEQMASDGEPISVNKLRRVAGVSAQVLRDHKQVVMAAVQRVNAEVHEKSFFA